MARTLPPLLTGDEKIAGPASEALVLGPEYIGSLGPRFAVLGTKVRAIQADEPPDRKLPPTGGIPRDRLFGVDFDNEPHGAIMGKSGAGKSNTTGVFVMNLVALQAQVYVAEPVESGDYSRFGDRISRATTPQGISDMLDFLCDEISRRRRLMATYVDPVSGRVGIAKYKDLPGNDGMLWGIFEEIAAIIGKASLFRSVNRGELVRRWFGQLTEIAQRGRAADVHGLFISQLTTLTSWGGEDGNGIRSNAAFRLCHDRNPENMKAAFDASAPATLKVIKAMERRSPGRVAYTYCDRESNGEVRVGQVMYVSEEDAYRWVQKFEPRDLERFD